MLDENHTLTMSSRGMTFHQNQRIHSELSVMGNNIGNHENDSEHFSELKNSILETYMDIMKDESREQLFKSLMKRGLVTNDIYAFVSQQAMNMDCQSGVDNKTMMAAMNAKLKDVRRSKRKKYRIKKKKEDELLETIDNKRSTFKKIIQKIRKEVGKEKDRIANVHEKKMNHLEHKQQPVQVEKIIQPTVTPKRLEDFCQLSIFGDQSDLPKPLPPKGPFVCNKKICLNKNELKILSKDPKFSVRGKLNRQKHLTEVERMTSKHRYNASSQRKNALKEKTAARNNTLLQDLGEVDFAEIDRIDNLYNMFQDIKGGHIYDPVERNIDFNSRRASHYKHNKNVCLPQPLSAEEELDCEVRRSAYSAVFDRLLNERMEEESKKKEKKGGKRSYRQYDGDTNLSKDEKRGLDSLKERLKSGEIHITQTDKSSRFAIMLREQYIASGMEHVKKDVPISWRDVKYLQGQVNGHMWWMNKIVGYGQKKEHERMNRNTQNVSMEVPTMVLLVKDHKKWDENSNKPIPSRPVVSGSRGINTHLSEFLSEILEPITHEMGSAEVCSTEETLAHFDDINSRIDQGEDVSEINMLDIISNDALDQSNTLSQGDASLIRLLEDCVENKSNSKGASEEDTCVGETNENVDLPDNIINAGTPLNSSTPCKNKQRLPSNQGTINQYFRVVEKNEACLRVDTVEWQQNLIKRDTSDAQKKSIFNEKIDTLTSACNRWGKLDKLREDKMKCNVVESGKIQDLSEKPQIQDFTKKPVLLGSDVVALYPSLGAVQSAEMAENAVLESNIKFTGFDFRWLIIYLFLMIGSSGMMREGLHEFIPVRNSKSNSRSLAARNNRALNNWKTREHDLDDINKKKMIGLLVKIVTLVLMETTVYTFAGKLYRQKEGAGIGLRSSACLAKIVMGMLDKKWSRIQNTWGIRVQLLLRYIDDIRIYLWPIREGWTWDSEGWIFNDIKDGKDDITRTSDELAKTLNDMLDFLRFTMETEMDFQSGWLPTLDTQTMVLESGKIMYKFFQKSMSNNIAIQFGTALASETVFNSLRQEVTRRLLNTSLDVAMEEKIKIIEDYIQILVNSGHKFAFVKAAVLQGITRYLFMLSRSLLDKKDKKFMPLHRRKSFKRHERLLTKYVGQMVWFQEEGVGDPFRRGWKKWIRRKNDGTEKLKGRKSNMKAKGGPCDEASYIHRKVGCSNNVSSPIIVSDQKLTSGTNKKTTTVMFVPSSKGSRLLKGVKAVEEKISESSNWKVKIIEQPGTPLLLCLSHKFPMEEGCCRGEMCPLCENDGLKCAPKGIVYSAICVKCNSNDQCDRRDFTYVGETSRPWRDRIKEHTENADNWKPKSFIIDHWMSQHPTDTVRPEFKFKILSAYPEALRRQLSEGLYILERGGLNRRNEFNQNNLCRLQAQQSSEELENCASNILKEKKMFTENITNFIEVMRAVHKLPNINDAPTKINRAEDNMQSCFRYFKRSNSWRPSDTGPEAGIKKCKIMDTSTPQHAWRQQGEQSPDTSPISRNDLSKEEFEDGNNAVFSDMLVKKKTNISDDLDTTALTPPKKMDSSEEMESFIKLTTNWSRAAVAGDIIMKTSSAPDVTSLNENSYYNMGRKKELSGNGRLLEPRNRSLSMGDQALDLSPWSPYEVVSKDDTNNEPATVGDLKENKEDPGEVMNSPILNIQPHTLIKNESTRVKKIPKRRFERKMHIELSNAESKVFMGTGTGSEVLNMCLTPGTSHKRTLQETTNKQDDTGPCTETDNDGCGSPDLKKPNMLNLQRSGLSQGKNIKNKRGGKKPKIIKETIYKYLSVCNPGNTIQNGKQDQKQDGGDVEQAKKLDFSKK